jgi:hypothetical protein
MAPALDIDDGDVVMSEATSSGSAPAAKRMKLDQGVPAEAEPRTTVPVPSTRRRVVLHRKPGPSKSCTFKQPFFESRLRAALRMRGVDLEAALPAVPTSGWLCLQCLMPTKVCSVGLAGNITVSVLRAFFSFSCALCFFTKKWGFYYENWGFIMEMGGFTMKMGVFTMKMEVLL